MFSTRTRLSIAQFLELYDSIFCSTLLEKYSNSQVWLEPGHLLLELKNHIEDIDDAHLRSLLNEIAVTTGYLRSKVSPKYRFDERWKDLEASLLLDGFILSSSALTPIDPSIVDLSAQEDDLAASLITSDLPHSEGIINCINKSNDNFRQSPADYNASLTNVRIAMETLAKDICAKVCCCEAENAKWGTTLQKLKEQGFISSKEETCLSGVYGLVSTGAHQIVGIPDAQMVRLGRSLALSMVWFLAKKYNSKTVA